MVPFFCRCKFISGMCRFEQGQQELRQLLWWGLQNLQFWIPAIKRIHPTGPRHNPGLSRRRLPWWIWLENRARGQGQVLPIQLWQDPLGWGQRQLQIQGNHHVGAQRPGRTHSSPGTGRLRIVRLCDFTNEQDVKDTSIDCSVWQPWLTLRSKCHQLFYGNNAACS